MRIKFFCVIILFIFITGCKFGKLRRSTDLKEKYDGAMAYYDKKEYYRCAILLEEIRTLITGTKEYELAEFRYAYCHYYQRQLTYAGYYFEKFYNTFRGSKYAQEARYMHVRSLYEESPRYNLDQKSTNDAIVASQSFLNAFPTSVYFEECSKILKELRFKLEKKAFEQAKLYLKINNFKASVVAFNNFQKNFPDSEYNEEASFLRITGQYEYAKQSIETRKKERYQEVIAHYEYFMGNYPSSKFASSAQAMYNRTLKIINDLKKVEKLTQN